jgi:NAD(P)-dependent dehydrogenase (short-subunit alcohol dehydrogenase family)
MSDVVVVTGGAGGMGLATAKIVGRHSLVMLWDVNQERLDHAKEELAGHGIAAETFVCDITDRNSVRDLAARARSLGPVVAVVHTAGVSPTMGSAERILRINALGTIYVNEAFYDIAEQDMSIVNVASMAGHQLPRLLQPERVYRHSLTDPEKFLKRMLTLLRPLSDEAGSKLAYGLSKSFVIWYSKATAVKFGSKGARIVSVSPGSFDTAMGQAEVVSGSVAMTQFGALKRLGTPQEIAEVLAFCASSRPGYLTGTDIICDGGVVATMTRRDSMSLMRLMAREKKTRRG